MAPQQDITKVRPANYSRWHRYPTLPRWCCHTDGDWFEQRKCEGALQCVAYIDTKRELAKAAHNNHHDYYWLSIFGDGTNGKVGNHNRVPKTPLVGSPTIDITLYPCLYEKTQGVIPNETINLILTDPPYLVSSNDISRNNQADLQMKGGL